MGCSPTRKVQKGASWAHKRSRNHTDSRDRRKPPFCQEFVNRLFHSLLPSFKL